MLLQHCPEGLQPTYPFQPFGIGLLSACLALAAQGDSRDVPVAVDRSMPNVTCETLLFTRCPILQAERSGICAR